MARKFLYIFTVLIVIVIAGAFAYAIWGTELIKLAMIPRAAFIAEPRQPAAAYRRAEMWLARPDKPGNPALWLPPGYTPATDTRAAVFFIHPTSFLNRSRWNAPKVAWR